MGLAKSELHSNSALYWFDCGHDRAYTHKRFLYPGPVCPSDGSHIPVASFCFHPRLPVSRFRRRIPDMSSSPELGGEVDVQRPTERTPLLPSYGSDLGAEHTAENINSVPYVGTFASNIAVEDLPSYSTANLYPQSLSSKPAARNAFALCVLLYHRKSIVGAGDKLVQSSRDVLTQWRKTAQLPISIHDLDTLVLRVWAESAVDGNTAEDVEEVLWSAFPVNPSSTVTVRGGRPG